MFGMDVEEISSIVGSKAVTTSAIIASDQIRTFQGENFEILQRTSDPFLYVFGL